MIRAWTPPTRFTRKALSLALCLAAFAAAPRFALAQEKTSADESKKPRAAETAATSSRSHVDVNSADVRALETLPGIGPTLAERIVEGRPYHSMADLEKVKGMTKSKVDALRGQISFGHTTATREKPTAEKAKEKESAATEKATTTAKRTEAKAAEETSAAASGASTAAHRTTSEAPTSGNSGKLAPGEKININTASAEELDRLPGIGPGKARAIVEYRSQNGPFKTIEDIQKVRGIKSGSFSKLQDFITVR